MLLASWVAATANFKTVDRVLGTGLRPELSAHLGSVPTEDRRVVLRHLASEINRWMFRWWSIAQMVLGILVVVLAWPVGGVFRVVAAAALFLTLGQAATVSPIVDLGRAIDFVPRPLPPDTASRFGLLHAAYVGSDLLKAALLIAAAWALARRPPA